MCTSHDVDDNTGSSDPRSGYRSAEGWPKYPADMQFEMGSGVAVDAQDIIYLFTRDIEHWAAHPLALKDKMGKSSISMFDREGNYLASGVPQMRPVLRLVPIRYTSSAMASSGRQIVMDMWLRSTTRMVRWS